MSQVGTVALLKYGTDKMIPLTATSTAPGPTRLLVTMAMIR